MGRVAYMASKEQFVIDVVTNEFMAKMKEGASLNRIGGGLAEVASWGANAEKIRNLLDLANLPATVIVSFEYKLPNSGGRIDCMLYGHDRNGRCNVVHLELKQWSNDTVYEIYENGFFDVGAFTGGAYRPVPHPSAQVANYQQHLKNFVVELNKPDVILKGLAYCYNYRNNKKPNALYAEHYQAILTEYPLYSGDQMNHLALSIHDLLEGGDGLVIFNRVMNSEIRQSKTLLNTVANMFNGLPEFPLLEDQIVAANAIFAEVKKASNDVTNKTVIIIKGGSGTGKTVIALHVLARIAQEGNVKNAFFTTRSTALRESLKQRLRKVHLNNKSFTDASGVIANIFDFKPYNYKEGEVDLLLVDEAHRVQDSANYMKDSMEKQTYLSQVMSLIYCSRVCVFFIDDKQAIKKEEIGNSMELEKSAKNYKANVLKFEGTKFYKDLLKKQKRIQKNIARRKELEHDTTASSYEIAKLTEKISKDQRHLVKFENLKGVVSTLSGSVKVVGPIELTSQFRCNGSDNYLDWLDEVLYRSSNDIVHRFNANEYDFQIFDNPFKLYEKIRSLNKEDSEPRQIARLVAGYCWAWSETTDEQGDLRKDVKIGDFEMPWETKATPAREFQKLYARSADTWAIDPRGVNQIGCIFSVQGFELDYIGVILGPDVTYDKEHDCLTGVVGHNHAIKTRNQQEYTTHVLNAYRVLLSRGRKGCYVYCCDPKVAMFLEKSLKNQNETK